MSGLSIIIPSKQWANLLACVTALRIANEDRNRIIVIDDGLERSGYTNGAGGGCLDGATIIPGLRPFIFSRNINVGIRAAGHDDVMLLNDDAILKSKDGFRIMQDAARQHPGIGLISAATNNVGNANQWPQGGWVRFDQRMVCFVAVLIPRRTIEQVGLLDEEFGGPGVYGFEDDAYCYRVRSAGLKIGIHDGCVVDHSLLPSTFRTSGPCDLSAGRQIFIDKFGSYPL